MTKFYMDGVLDERERILILIEYKIGFLEKDYPEDEKEKHTIARLKNLHENIKDTAKELNKNKWKK